MKKYEFVGEVSFRGHREKFSKVVEGKSESHALHKLYSLFGSHNRVKRSAVKVVEVKEHGG